MAKYKRWSLPLSQAASSFLCDLWCLLPQPRGGRAKLLPAGRLFESHPREKGEKPPLQSPSTETRAPAETHAGYAWHLQRVCVWPLVLLNSCLKMISLHLVSAPCAQPLSYSRNVPHKTCCNL